jgi:hypothetical protein
MSLPARQRHAFARLALFAMLLLAFAPTVSRWLAADRGPGWALICSAQPAVDEAPGASARPGAPGNERPAPAHVFEHCPFCALHVDLALPPPPIAAAAAQAVAFRELPRAFLAAPRGGGVWASAQPRAPPTRA